MRERYYYRCISCRGYFCIVEDVAGARELPCDTKDNPELVAAILEGIEDYYECEECYRKKFQEYFRKQQEKYPRGL